MKKIKFHKEHFERIEKGLKSSTIRFVKPQPDHLFDGNYAWKGGVYSLNLYPERSTILENCPYGKMGEIIKLVQNGSFFKHLKARIKKISIERILNISPQFHLEEGFESQKEFLFSIMKIYGSNIIGLNSWFWVIKFEVIK